MLRRLWIWLEANAKQLGAIKTIFGIAGSIVAVLAAVYFYLIPSEQAPIVEATVTLPLNELEAREQGLRTDLASARAEIDRLSARLEELEYSDVSLSDISNTDESDQNENDIFRDVLAGAPSCSPNIYSLTEQGNEINRKIETELGRFPVLNQFDQQDIADIDQLCAIDDEALESLIAESEESYNILAEQIQKMSEISVCANQWIDFVEGVENVASPIQDVLIRQTQQSLQSFERPARSAYEAISVLENSMSNSIDAYNTYQLVCSG